MLSSLCEALDLICRTQRIGWGQQTRAGYGGAHFYQHWTGGGRKIESLRLSSDTEVGGQPGICEVLSPTKSKQTSGKARRVPESKTCAPTRKTLSSAWGQTLPFPDIFMSFAMFPSWFYCLSYYIHCKSLYSFWYHVNQAGLDLSTAPKMALNVWLSGLHFLSARLQACIP